VRVAVDVGHAGLPGVGRFATELAGALARRDDITVVPVHGRGGWWARAGFTSAPAGVDVHHATHLGVPHLGVTRRGQVPVVLTVHDLFPLTQRHHSRSAAARAYYRQVLPSAVRRATMTVAVSDYTAAEMERRLGRRPDAVIGHGVDHAAWGAAAVAEPTLSEPYILYVGTAKWHKDLPTLLAAHAAVPSLPPLVLAGPTARDAGLPEAGLRQRALGRVSDPALAALYRRATVVALPSRYEGVGLTALEGMWFGAPVVAAESPGLRDTVGDAALLVEGGRTEAWADALSRVTRDPVLRDALREKGKVRAAACRWDDAAAAYVDVYRRAVER
jgi:glycosyltransferase involved in cell wall biosynthesis